MNKQLLAAIAVGTLLLGGGVYVASSSEEPAAEASATTDAEAPAPTSRADTKDPAQTRSADTATDDGSESSLDAAREPAGTFVTATAEDIEGITSDKRVLFFHASWCSTCKGLASDISSNESKIPPGLAIAKVDFDTETDLKKRYGVTVQHTLVQIDGAGNEIARWSGTPDLATLVRELQ